MIDPKLQAWVTDNYPVPADRLTYATDRQCIQHALKKWRGALKIKKYGLTYEDHCISAPIPANVLITVSEFYFGEESCSLCKKYAAACYRNKIPCPIIRYQGYSCDDNHDNTYYKSANDPQPMIQLLKSTLEFVKQEPKP